ncbi:accessory gene regulator ArgB-like protein [Clostridium botulinum]|uniref:accessory gene regulator ArgB-like protein n=1 Tax=Clostridium botulinum TaxID=1491 RepID=UPI0004D90910|nr:accessory gene regulator B family protein [Clostridium botulinum]KEI06851.1 accessory gene regulator AgrB [Clostridium botulinum C/D str. BKT75002]KEI11606.1 accessory gene regulator AgrB [Clostridium botulinum C/D str. BKT2873]MCD3351694.1 accessory regulator AgrB [Clostridium botulinum D/C]MCD3360594.1 accessory regulator AgrB [Clostridium botulinum D/C]MCD3363782.1 accessory regulator AgrB [Clostridium botulinum D/C]
MKISERFAIKITEYIKNTLPDKNEDDLAIIKYGVELLFMSVTKIPIILGIGYFLGTLKETIFTVLAFCFIRRFAAGIHARKSYICLLSTCLILQGSIYLSINFNLKLITKILILVICMMIYLKYAPADTEEKPYVNEQIRKSLKIKSIFTITIYFIISIKIKEVFISNMLMHVLWIEGLLITPIIYKIFKRRYYNYEYYE